MSGIKQKSGGLRAGAGRPRALHVKGDAWRELRILTLNKRALQPDITEEDVLALLIHNAWYDLDQGFQETACIMAEGENNA